MRNDSSSDVAASEAEAEAEDERSITAVADEPAVTRERAPEVQPGDVLAGRYQIEAAIGKGGSGVVMRAFDRVSATVVALKVLKPGLTHDPRWEKRFQRELRLGRPIRHPNVCRIFDIGDADGYRFLTMEFATGGTLRDLIKQNKPLRPLPERLSDAAGVIAGLAAIHDAGIVHRDVKPDNMLRMEDGRLVLSDFGLATDLPDGTMVSVFVGTPHYMAPEVREGDPATTRSDVWSLGVALHEIFFGRRPERRNSRAGASSAKGPMTKTSSTVERAMFALCERCMADDPGDRPADADAVLKLFESARSSPWRVVRSVRSRRAFVIPLAAISLVAGALVASRFTRRGGPGEAKTSNGHVTLTPLGEPVDWSKRSKLMASFPDRVHCFSMINERTARVVWGTPRRAEDIEISSGDRRPSSLLPETYRTGCPELSPQGDRLLFTSTAASGMTEIELSTTGDGSAAKVMTPGLEPLWLRNGEEFIYSIDPYHASLFSLRTMSFTLLPDPNLGGRQLLSDKAASPAGDLVALSFVDDSGRRAISTYEGSPLSLRATFMLPAGPDVTFDGRGHEVLVSHNLSRSASTLAALDWRAGTLTHLGRYDNFDIVDVAPAMEKSTAILTRRRAKDAWLRERGRSRKLTHDGQTFSAAIYPDGDLLLGKRGQDGAISVWRQGHDGTLAQITTGPLDLRPDVSADGRRWVYVDGARQLLMICAGRSATSCSVLRKDEALPTWPRFSPDGSKLAYVTVAGAQQVNVLSLANGSVKQLGAAFAQCPPIWSSPTRLWTFEGSAKHYVWIERDVESGAATNRRIDLGESVNDANQDPDERHCWPPDDVAEAALFPKIRIETEEISNLLRLASDVRRR
jgi:serine/threonine protein kinase